MRSASVASPRATRSTISGSGVFRAEAPAWCMPA